MLIDEPPPDPPSGVALLARRLAVSDEPPVDQLPMAPSAGARRPLGCSRSGGTAEASACLTARR